MNIGNEQDKTYSILNNASIALFVVGWGLSFIGACIQWIKSITFNISQGINYAGYSCILAGTLLHIGIVLKQPSINYSFLLPYILIMGIYAFLLYVNGINVITKSYSIMLLVNVILIGLTSFLCKKMETNNDGNKWVYFWLSLLLEVIIIVNVLPELYYIPAYYIIS
jgi:hypothetical protein